MGVQGNVKDLDAEAKSLYVSTSVDGQIEIEIMDAQEDTIGTNAEQGVQEDAHTLQDEMKTSFDGLGLGNGGPHLADVFPEDGVDGIGSTQPDDTKEGAIAKDTSSRKDESECPARNSDLKTSTMCTCITSCVPDKFGTQPALTSAMVDFMIEVHVGLEGSVIGVHRGLLCHHSARFREVLADDSEQLKSRKLILRDENAAVFDVFKLWLYTGSHEPREPREYRGYLCLYWEIDELFDFYVFAERWGVMGLQNQVMDQIIGASNYWIRNSGVCIPKAWLISPPSSPLRKFIVDRVLTHPYSLSCLKEVEVRSFPEDLLVAIGLRALYEKATRWIKNDVPIRNGLGGGCNAVRCQRYHVHKEVHEES